jgi:hypothetical protein
MLGVNLTGIPPYLTQLLRWMMWQEQERNGKRTKVPLTAAGRAAKSTDPATWCDFNTASGVLRLKLRGFDGIGVCLGQLGDTGETLGGFDFDSCINPDGTLAAWAQPIVALLVSVTYGELSPSGSGLKFFFRSLVADIDQLRPAFGITPAKFGTKKSVLSASNGQEHGPAIEIYLGHGRYFAATGNHWPAAQKDVALLDLPTLLAIAEKVRDATGTTPKPGKPREKKSAGRDTSRSAVAFRLGIQLFREGKTFDEMCAELRAHEDTAEWCKEKGDIDNGRELQRIWEAAERAADGRTLIIRIVEGDQHRNADEGETALIATSYDIFQRGVMVRPAISELPAADGGKTYAATLHEVSTYGLIDALSRVALWVRDTEKGPVSANPPYAVASILRDRVGNWRLSICRGIIMTPTITASGDLLSKAGFDPVTSYYLWLPPDLHVPAIPDRPSKPESEAALQRIEKLLSEFPFVDKASKSVALSLIICAVIRPAMPVCPIHAATSPAAGSGKSYLFDVAAAISSGNRCPVIFAGAGKEELEKKLNGLLLAGGGLINLDNLDQPLQGDLLCQAATQPVLDLRRLGKSDPVRSMNGSLIGANGNNMPVHGDLSRRVLESQLDRGVERPELHVFKDDPVKQVLADRGRYIADVLTVVRGCISAPDTPEVPPLASYEAYTKFVRQPLMWLGRTDPVDALVGARKTDPIRDELVEFMVGWEKCIGLNVPITAAHVAAYAAAKGTPDPGAGASVAARNAWADETAAWKEFGPIVIAMCGARGQASPREVGDFLRKHKNRPVDGRKFLGKSGHRGAVRWQLVPVAP